MLVQVNEKKGNSASAEKWVYLFFAIERGAFVCLRYYFPSRSYLFQCCSVTFLFFFPPYKVSWGQEPKILQEWLSTNKQPKEKKKFPRRRTFLVFRT